MMEGKLKVEQLVGNLKEYAETRFDMAVLNTQDKMTDLLASIASMAIVVVCTLLILIFGSVGAGWWLGQLLHSPSLGFLCVAGFYLIVALIIFVNRDNWIKIPLINLLLKKININEQD